MLDPAEFGIEPVVPEALRGGDRVHNAAVVREVLAGGAPQIRDAVVLNAAAAIAAHDGLAGRPLHDALAAGLVQARRAIDEGAATDILERWIDASQAVRG